MRHRPVPRGNPADSLKNIEKGVLYPSDLLPDIPETAEHALLRALSPNADDRMIDVGEFGDGFLPGLGNPREGRRSLARVIARLTSDEGEPDSGEAEAQGRVWELDPAEGYLGSRTGRARAYALGAVSGLAVTAVSWSLLGDLHVGERPGARRDRHGHWRWRRPRAANRLGARRRGWLMLVLNNTPLLSALPVAILSFALFAAWWLVWGRLQPAASATFAAAAALALACGDASLAAP